MFYVHFVHFVDLETQLCASRNPEDIDEYNENVNLTSCKSRHTFPLTFMSFPLSSVKIGEHETTVK